MTKKHLTERPWRAYKASDGGYFISTYDYDNLTVIDACISDDSEICTGPLDKKTAELIARAPDLIEAVRQAKKEIVRLRNELVKLNTFDVCEFDSVEAELDRVINGGYAYE